MKKYKLYDIYEEELDLIGEYETLKQVAKACNDYHNECEGEWIPRLYEGNKELKKYILCSNWTYEKNTINFKGGK